MARVLLVDDDPDQLEIRRLLFQQAGHEVCAVPNPAQALEAFCHDEPQLVVTDLRLPETADGLALIRALRERSPSVCIVVLSGWPADLDHLPETGLVDAVVSKPPRTDRLLALAAKLTLWMIAALTTFAPVASAAELVADLEITSSSMERVELSLDGAPVQHVMAYPGYAKQPVPVFFSTAGPAGRHIRTKHSPGIQVEVANLREVAPGDESYLPLAYAPIVHARADTIENMSDAPVVAYCERLTEGGVTLLQYTMVFTNEDGGTSTRGLMARWGRTTDIEYIYRAYLKPDGSLLRATIQGRGHKEIEFEGRRDGRHPLLIPVTRNNMVSGEATSPARFQLAPQVVDLSSSSRELVMDRNPFLYRVASEELSREEKLRPFGTVDGEKIGDPRNYVYIEAKITNRGSAVAALVRLKGENRLRSSHLGRAGFAIERDGRVRTTVELPPATAPERVDAIGFECLVVAPSRNAPLPDAGLCRIERVNKAFFLDRDYRPGASFFEMTKPVEIPAGQIVEFTVR
ncbi:MAG: response regulator [Acidobacteriales bacterium]|nr:response regulator [Terriglobales bacterium]